MDIFDNLPKESNFSLELLAPSAEDNPTTPATRSDAGTKLDELIANITYQYNRYNWTNEELHAALDDVLPSMDAVSHNMQVFIIVMYSLTAFLSVVGNTTVIVVLVCGKM